MATQNVLVVGGGKWQVDLIKTLKANALRTVVVDMAKDCPGGVLADKFYQVNIMDPGGILKVAHAEGISWVTSDQSDPAVPSVAFLNEQLGLPGIRPAVAEKFTNKYSMRNALLNSDIPMPAYAEVSSCEEAEQFARQKGFPIVLKPKSARASIGVYKVDSFEELRSFFSETVAHSKDRKILVEEFIQGTEVTVEGLSVDHRFTLLACSEKEHYPHNPCVARKLAYPPRFSSEVLERISVVANKVVTTLGLEDGISHAEYRIRNGVPYLIEVAARGGGTRISSLITTHICGFDSYQIMVDKFLGKPINLTANHQKAAILEFFEFVPGKVKSIGGLSEALEIGIAADIGLNFQVGDTILPANDDNSRAGYFICLGDSREDVERKSKAVKDIIRIDYFG